MSESAVIYVRMSADRTGEGAGVARQRDDCETLAKLRGLDVLEVVEDNDLSASGKASRPGFERVLELLESDAVRVIVAWNLDRLSRNRRDTLRLIETAQSHGVVVALVRGADLDMSTPGGRLMADLFGAIAKNEIDVKSDRQRRANRQRAEAGRPHRARRAFGYEPDGLHIRPAEAELVREMVTKYLTGWTFREIAQWLNDTGATSTQGKQFTIKVTKDHVTSKRNAGIRVYEGQEFDGVWEPIIDRATHERVMAEVERRGTERSQTATGRSYLLTGLLSCGRCGQPMVGHAKKDPGAEHARPKYVCPNYPHGDWCGNNTRLAVPLDHLVREAVIYRLDTPVLATEIRERSNDLPDVQHALASRRRLEERLEALVDDFADGVLSRAQFARAKQRVADDLEGVNRQLRAASTSVGARELVSAEKSAREAWDAQSQGWRRQLLSAVLHRIVVHPSRKRPIMVVDGKPYRFDWESIEFKWAH